MIKGLIPVNDGWLSQGYSSSHRGIDLGWIDEAKCKVRAWNDGEVIGWGADGYVDPKTGKPDPAWFIVLKHDNGQWSGYWHLDECPKVKTGQRVKKGEVIGIRGASGNAKGIHLHFLLTKPLFRKYNYTAMVSNTIDPVPWLYKLETDHIEDVNLPVEEDQFDHEAMKKTVNHDAELLITDVFGELGYDVENFKIEYDLKER